MGFGVSFGVGLGVCVGSPQPPQNVNPISAHCSAFKWGASPPGGFPLFSPSGDSPSLMQAQGWSAHEHGYVAHAVAAAWRACPRINATRAARAYILCLRPVTVLQHCSRRVADAVKKKRRRRRVFFSLAHTEVSTTPRLDRSPSTGYERLCAKEFEPDSFCVASEHADGRHLLVSASAS